MEADAEDLQRTVERLHNCYATLREVIPVAEKFQDKPVWEGVVHAFEIRGHPSASICYAWSSPIEGSERRRFYAVLHQPPITSPIEAVRASIIHDYR